MNKFQKRRLTIIILCAIIVAIAVSLILYALKQNINVFLTPSEIHTAQLEPGYHFRLGGMVKKGSVVHEKNNLDVHFVVTDLKQEIAVSYSGILPDLFREGTGVIAEGQLSNDHQFIASQILAKHDEKYMPQKINTAK